LTFANENLVIVEKIKNNMKEQPKLLDTVFFRNFFMNHESIERGTSPLAM